jgi:integrase
MDLADLIKEKRPKLSPNSVKTYKSILTNIYRKCFPDDDEMQIKKFDDTECIMDHLKDIPFNKRKTTLAALVVITENKDYTKLMTEDINKYNQNQLLQKKEGKFENMIPIEEVEGILKKLEKEAKHLYKKENLEMKDYQKIQDYILLALTGGIYQAPRRSLDWVMLVKDYDVEKDNYIDMKNKVFVFNSYKTAKSNGSQTIEIVKPLLTILKKWISILPADMKYLLFDGKGNHITPSQITHRLNNIFGKPISTSLLRHIYLTSKFSNVNLKDLKDTANAMGNSPMVALEYVKK